MITIELHRNGRRLAAGKIGLCSSSAGILRMIADNGYTIVLGVDLPEPTEADRAAFAAEMDSLMDLV